MCVRAGRVSRETRYICKRTHHQGEDDDDDDDDRGGEVTERVLHLLPTGGIVKATETVRSTRKRLHTVTGYAQIWREIEIVKASPVVGYRYRQTHGKSARQYLE
jgi:hypothetical protein